QGIAIGADEKIEAGARSKARGHINRIAGFSAQRLIVDVADDSNHFSSLRPYIKCFADSILVSPDLPRHALTYNEQAPVPLIICSREGPARLQRNLQRLKISGRNDVNARARTDRPAF